MTSRAGKDLVSCLVSGLLTIGPRFGGAIDDAARYFQDACDRGLEPDDFVEEMKKKGIRVPGIGHRIKSKVRAHIVPTIGPQVCKGLLLCGQWLPRLAGWLLPTHAGLGRKLLFLKLV